MEIAEIKARLTLATVLAHYGLTPNRHQMLCCPFHADQTPSMQVYPETNTVFCFSSHCATHGKRLDVIDFVMYREQCSKHEALEKAKRMADPGYVPPRSRSNHSPVDLGRIAVLSKLMQEAQASLLRSGKGQAYCKERGLSLPQLEIGFLAERFYQGWNEKLQASALSIGLLRELPNKSFSPAFRDCLLFALKNAQGQPVSLYGRSVNASQTTPTARHFYLQGKHQGLYPGYPPADTGKLILTESIIDAASIWQLPEVSRSYAVLALYGTNGLTDEHLAAIQGLPALDELVFLLDGDEAGAKATEKYSQQLHRLLPHLTISQGEIPLNEDVNSLLVGHEPSLITHVLEKRRLLFSPEKKGVAKEMEVEKEKAVANENNPSPEAVQAGETATLNTANPDKIIYHTPQLTIEIWGGIDYGHLHRLRLSLYLENKQTQQHFRDDINLYSHRSTQGFLQDASEALGLSPSDLKASLTAFTRVVEAYRLQQKAASKTLGQAPAPVLSSLAQSQALKHLKDKHLVQYLKGAMQKTGLIGETDNGLLLFLIFLTRYFAHPLHALVHGSSGSGKTNLLKSILQLVPEESKYVTTALTENVLFRPPYPAFWKNKILLLEDLDGSYKALYPLRELMSNQHISKFVSEPDPKTGQFKQVLLEAHGPICIAGATTKDKVYEDNSNRSFLLHVDESSRHQNQILDYQNRQAAGLIDSAGIESVCRKIQDIQRLLNPHLQVINPFQPQLKLPSYVFKKLRTNTHYITLIQSITFLHQHQREQKKNERGQLYIETILEDVALANTLSKQSLLRKSDELSGQVRDFFESLKGWVQESGQAVFLSKDIREHFRLHPMKLKRQLDELASRGYVRKTGGNKRVSYEYEILVWDDYQVLQDGLKRMDELLAKLWATYPDGRYQKEAKTKEEVESP